MAPDSPRRCDRLDQALSATFPRVADESEFKQHCSRHNPQPDRDATDLSLLWLVWRLSTPRPKKAKSSAGGLRVRPAPSRPVGRYASS